MPDLWVDVDAAVIVPVNVLPLLDDTDFKTIETAVVYNSAGLAVTWNFVTAAGVVTGTAVTPTTAGVYDWSEPIADKGMYAIEIPASGGVSINNDTEGVGWFTGVATGVLPWRGPTIGFRRAALNDLFIDGGTASTNLEDFFDGTGYAGGTIKLAVNLAQILGTTLTETAGQIAAAFKKFFDKAVTTGTINSIPDAVAGAASGLAIVGSNMGTATSVTGAVGSVTGAVGSVAADVGITQAGADKVWSSAARTLTAFSTALAVSVWDVLAAAVAVASSIGLQIKTNLDVVLSTRLATSGYTAPPTVGQVADQVWDEALSGHLGVGSTGEALAAVKADAAAILVDTGTTLDGRIPAALSGAGNMKADALAVDGSTTAATNLKQSATVIYVGSVTGAATTTTLIDSALTQAATDFWKGRIIIFLTGTLKFQATDITAFDAALDKLTFTALTEAPAAADQYVIL